MKKSYSSEKKHQRYLANRDYQIVWSNNNRAKKVGAPGVLQVADWQRLKTGPCAYCGTDRFPLEIDHRIPLSRGGTNELDNIQAACTFCNRAKRHFDEAEFLEWIEVLRTMYLRHTARIVFGTGAPRVYQATH
jgi:5-methylcytosine-specific restriction endonuclease McrA